MLTERRREKLLALLRLTESDKEHEALAALRKANAILKAEGLTWDSVLKPGRFEPRPEPQRSDAEPQPHRPDWKQWQGADHFADAFTYANGGYGSQFRRSPFERAMAEATEKLRRHVDEQVKRTMREAQQQPEDDLRSSLKAQLRDFHLRALDRDDAARLHEIQGRILDPEAEVTWADGVALKQILARSTHAA